MNCRPGDLAVTHSAPMDNGLLVEVIDRPSHDYMIPAYMGPCWLVRSQGSLFHVTPTRQADIAIWPDSMLRPIRAPGITTEEVTSLFSPSPAKESEKV